MLEERFEITDPHHVRMTTPVSPTELEAQPGKVFHLFKTRMADKEELAGCGGELFEH